MAKIYVSKLNAQVKKNILQHKYTLEQVRQIREHLNGEMEKKQKGFRNALIIASGIMVLMLFLTFVQMGFSEMFLFISGITIVAICCAFVIAWVASMGVIKFQYNQVIKKAYPEYKESLCL